MQCRMDFNAPLDENGAIADEKIAASRPCRRSITSSTAERKSCLCTHHGRPKDEREPKQSLWLCAARLAGTNVETVILADDCAAIESVQLCEASVQSV